MFESIGAWKMRSSGFASLSLLSSLVFVVITCKNVIVVSDLLKLLFGGNLLKLFFLVPVWIYAYTTVCFHLSQPWICWITSLFEWCLFHLIVVVEVSWWFVVFIIWDLTHYHLLLSHSRMSLIVRIMLVILLRLLSVLLWSVVWNLKLTLLWSLLLLLELRCLFISWWNSSSHGNDCWYFSFVLWR